MADLIRRYTVPESVQTDSDSTLRLVEFLEQQLKDIPRTRIKQMLKHKQVMVDGAIQTVATAELTPGASVAVNLSREFIVFNHRRLKIVYEDEDIIVVEKGYGLLSIGTDSTGKKGAKQVETAYSLLRDYVKRVDSRNKLFVVHRLDRDTSGLMMFAKNMAAKEALQHNWNNMVLERKYVAVVKGAPESETGVIRSYLNENSKYTVYSQPNADGGGKLAVTRYRVLQSNSRYSLMEVQLDTGRKNQIRVHMADIGCPISGDRKYGPDVASPLHRLALHAQTLRFVHPATRRMVSLSTPIPAPFISLTR